jgi:predicted RNase H-like HicB family nuclease
MKINNKFSGIIEEIGKYTYWWYEGCWVGYLEEFPEYLSQGETRAELEEGFLKIYDLVMKGDLQIR